MKIDIHSHILPGIDDGAKTLEDSVQLVSEMAGWGFERITCTPHITKKFRNTRESIKEKFDILCNAVADKGLGVELRMSAEYRLNPETWPEILAEGGLMPIEDKYILMEFPINVPSEMGDLIPMEEFRKVLSLGLTPVLPHPERYFYLDHDELLRYVDAGVKIQSNYGSLAGVYGLEVRDRAQSLIDEGIVSFLASDMHNMLYIKTISDWLHSGNSLWDL
jgi:tyrosine-protein phosphatase YwqE